MMKRVPTDEFRIVLEYKRCFIGRTVESSNNRQRDHKREKHEVKAKKQTQYFALLSLTMYRRFDLLVSATCTGESWMALLVK